MNSQPYSKQLIQYYQQHAKQYCENTQNLDMRDLYAPFLARLPVRAHILDAGCGSGRDSLYFLSQGYTVTSMDAAEALVQYATQLIGQPVLHMTFQEMDFDREFDGVWACASLLHVARAEMDDVFSRLARAVKPGGIAYVSFKYGNQEAVRHGRLFSDYNEETFQALLDKHPTFKLVEMWSTDDIRPDRNTQWLNAILKISP